MKPGGPLRRVTPLRRRRPSRQWWQARKFVESRANGWCEAGLAGCHGVGRHAHHILMRSAGGSDDPGNLLWVCGWCHHWIHVNPSKAVERGLLRRRAA